MTKTRANTRKCVICKRKAYAFWPCIDPDIQMRPYCRKCLEKRRLEALMILCGIDPRKVKG